MVTFGEWKQGRKRGLAKLPSQVSRWPAVPLTTTGHTKRSRTEGKQEFAFELVFEVPWECPGGDVQ